MISFAKPKRKRKSKRRRDAPDSSYNGTDMAEPEKRASERLSAFYAAEPAVRLGATNKKKQENKADADPGKRVENIEKEERPGTPLFTHGKQPVKETVKASGRVIRLAGRTEGEFDGASYETRRTRVTSATGCGNCGDDDCIRVRGILVAKYHVTTNVTLPSVSDYPDLTPCQQRRVRNAINNVLAPHEQRHVAAFETYNGVTRRRFDLTLCRSEFEPTIRSMFEEEEQARRTAAKNASDDLDPFFFDVDLECEDKK